jgi:hypothetical protein
VLRLSNTGTRQARGREETGMGVGEAQNVDAPQTFLFCQQHRAPCKFQDVTGHTADKVFRNACSPERCDHNQVDTFAAFFFKDGLGNVSVHHFGKDLQFLRLGKLVDLFLHLLHSPINRLFFQIFVVGWNG